MLTPDDTKTRDEGVAAKQVQQLLSRYSGGSVSVAHLLCDRHADAANGVALIYEDASGGGTTCTYSEIRDLSVKFAVVLRDLGAGPGSRVATLLPPVPELLITTLAIWRLGAVHVPLPTDIGKDAVRFRVEDCQADAVVVSVGNRSKLNGWSRDVGSGDGPAIVTLQGGKHDQDELPNETDTPFWSSLHDARGEVDPVASGGDDPFILLYTPEGNEEARSIEVPVRELASIEAYMRSGLKLLEADRFWNMVSPGRWYGLFYGLIGPMLLDQTTLFCNAPFNVESTYRLLTKYGITNLVAGSGVFRRMPAEGFPEGLRKHFNLRVVTSVGEELPPHIVDWVANHLGVGVQDHHGKTAWGSVLEGEAMGELG